MTRASLLAAIAFGTADVLTPRVQAQAALPRIDTKAALAAVIKRVDPIVPPVAAAANVGGSVIANVTIRANGTVESVDVIDGPAMLLQPAIDAFRQWTFKPFVVNGRPTRVVTLLDVTFPDPVADEARRIEQAWQDTFFACRTALESAVKTAPEVCAERVALADKLPRNRVLERRGASRELVVALLRNDRVYEARTQMERTLLMGGFALNDAEAADDYMLMATVYVEANDLRAADDALAQAVGIYERAIETITNPALKNAYASRLREALGGSAAVKRRLGNTAAALALEAKVKALETSSRPPVVVPSRAIASVLAIGSDTSHLTEGDVRAIGGVAGGRPWLIQTSSPAYSNGKPEAWVYVYLQPDVATAQLRRGRAVIAAPTHPDSDGYPTDGLWMLLPMKMGWGQIPLAGRDAGDVQNDRDRNRPFQIMLFPDAPVPSDDAVISVVTFLRTSAVEPSGAPKLFSEIQPWAIRDVSFRSEERAEIALVEPHGDGIQDVTLQRDGASWKVTRLAGGALP